MKKISTEQLFKQTSKTLFATGIGLALLVVSEEVYTAVTGEKIASVRMIEENGVKAVVIKGDTAYFATPKSDSLLAPPSIK